MDADGSNKQRVTDLPGANWAPFFHPDGERILFSSNHHDGGGRDFAIFMINITAPAPQRTRNPKPSAPSPWSASAASNLSSPPNRAADRSPPPEPTSFVPDGVNWRLPYGHTP